MGRGKALQRRAPASRLNKLNFRINSPGFYLPGAEGDFPALRCRGVISKPFVLRHSYLFLNSESNWPQFSADRKSVFYQHFESGVSGTLWRVPIEGGPPAKVSEGFAIRPTLSPDGKWVAFWHDDGQDNSRWRLAVMQLNGEKQFKTFEVSPTVLVQWDTMLRWASDSRSLAYVDHRRGIDNLWAQSIDGGPPKQLMNFTDSSIFSFDWSREGQLVASRGVITTDVVLITDADR